MSERPFELGGVNHLALVCRDMERTVEFYSGVLGMPLIKTIQLPADRDRCVRGMFPKLSFCLFGVSANLSIMTA